MKNLAHLGFDRKDIGVIGLGEIGTSNLAKYIIDLVDKDKKIIIIDDDNIQNKQSNLTKWEREEVVKIFESTYTKVN
jgi:ABC-type oligopeptide transport system ATPase subunit